MCFKHRGLCFPPRSILPHLLVLVELKAVFTRAPQPWTMPYDRANVWRSNIKLSVMCVWSDCFSVRKSACSEVVALSMLRVKRDDLEEFPDLIFLTFWEFLCKKRWDCAGMMAREDLAELWPSALSLLHRQHPGEYKAARWNQTGEP